MPAARDYANAFKLDKRLMARNTRDLVSYTSSVGTTFSTLPSFIVDYFVIRSDRDGPIKRARLGNSVTWGNRVHQAGGARVKIDLLRSFRRLAFKATKLRLWITGGVG